MKITDQDIIRTAKNLRDEENEQLHVAPWHSHRRFHVPAWLVAVPAAAVIGFLFGLWVNSASKPDAPLTAMTDTVYIKVKETPDLKEERGERREEREYSGARDKEQGIIIQETGKTTGVRRHVGNGRGQESADKSQENSLSSLLSPLSSEVSPTGHSIADDKIRYDLLLVN